MAISRNHVLLSEGDLVKIEHARKRFQLAIIVKITNSQVTVRYVDGNDRILDDEKEVGSVVDYVCHTSFLSEQNMRL